MKKLTLEDKKLLNEHVTGETKRCLSIINKSLQDPEVINLCSNQAIDLLKKLIIVELINSSPYIEFHPELLKRIPKE